METFWLTNKKRMTTRLKMSPSEKFNKQRGMSQHSRFSEKIYANLGVEFMGKVWCLLGSFKFASAFKLSAKSWSVSSC